jgi:hypothetical protein
MTNKDLIKQYVDTGLQLPQYQFSKLPDWAKKTYIRKRIIAVQQHDDERVQLLPYELVAAPEEYQNQVIHKITDKIIDFGLDGDHGEDNTEFNFKYGSTPDLLMNMFADSDAMIVKLFNNPEFRAKINADIIKDSLSWCQDPRLIPQTLGDALFKKFVALQSVGDVKSLIVYAQHPVNMVEALGEPALDRLVPATGDGDRSYQVSISDLIYAYNPNEILTLLGERGVEELKTIQHRDLWHSIYNGRNIPALIALYQQNGVDVKGLLTPNEVDHLYKHYNVNL